MKKTLRDARHSLIHAVALLVELPLDEWHSLIDAMLDDESITLDEIRAFANTLQRLEQERTE